MLVEVSVPLEIIGKVECDYDGNYHMEIMGQECITDEDTYGRVIKARASHYVYKLEVEVDKGV